MRHNKLEILAPAGNKESFISAINAGANAVYLAGKNFGARKNANNFTNEEIKEMIEYAHLRNVLVFVTINTIIFEEELIDLFTYADYLVQNNVDALIVQDIGVIEEFCTRYPDVEIHASTQMNSYNLEQVLYLKGIGVKRVIFARETPLEDIKNIASKVDIDLEVFVHGALCVSYSGNCSLSYFMGGRSGNRGECAQPCRLKYKLKRDNEVVSDSSYLMSTKDLMTIEYINEIAACGIRSLKIEGRMKKPSYVAATVTAYKEALENSDTIGFDLNKRISELQVSFNRDFTKGYILNELPFDINNDKRPNHQGIEIGKVLSYDRGRTTVKLFDTLTVSDGIRIEGKSDIGGVVSRILKDNEKVKQAYKNDIVVLDMQSKVSKDSKVIKTLDISQETEMMQYLNESFKLVPISGKMFCIIGEPIRIELNLPFISKLEVVSDFIVETAERAETVKEDIFSTFNTLGNTFYNLKNFDIVCDKNIFIPKRIIKSLKRTMLETIRIASLKRNTPKTVTKDFEVLDKTVLQKNINVKVETIEQYNACKEFKNINVFVSENLNIQHQNICQNRIIQDYKKYQKYDNIIIQDFGSINQLSDKNLYANYNMNIVNSYSLYSLAKRGVTNITMSLESTFENTKAVIENYLKDHQSIPNLEIMAYGRNDNMISKYCPITKSEGVNKLDCNLCVNNNYSLIDDKDKTFPLIRDTGCNIRVVNFKPINNIYQLGKYSKIGITSFRVEFTNESQAEVRKILRNVIGTLNV